MRGARRARRPGQHPSHRLPSLLRAALHRRHRPARPARCRPPTTATPSRAITSTSAAASARTRRSRREIYRDVKAEDAPRDRRAHAQGLSRAPRLAAGNLPRLHPPPRHRRAASRCSTRRRSHERCRRRRRSLRSSRRARRSRAEQRAWLNGFFAGLLSLDARRHAAVAASRRRRCCRRARPARHRPATDDDDDAPWHDPAMPLAERMKLAEGRPLRRRMMAAMAQQDCGQCGYNCQDYSDAIFSARKSG